MAMPGSTSFRVVNWNDVLPAARFYFRFWPSGEDLLWAKFVWRILGEAGELSYSAEADEQRILSWVPMLSLCYQLSARHGCWIECERFQLLQDKQFDAMCRDFSEGWGNEFDSLIDILSSEAGQVAARLWLSFEEGSSDIAIAPEEQYRIWTSCVSNAGDIYHQSDQADIYLSLSGYEGRSGPLGASSVAELFSLAGKGNDMPPVYERSPVSRDQKIVH